jgi:hypothetical protein
MVPDGWRRLPGIARRHRTKFHRPAPAVKLTLKMIEDPSHMKDPKRILLSGYVTCGLVAQRDVRRARDGQDWLLIAERFAPCPMERNARHSRTLYRNSHGTFLREKAFGACDCSRQHWHAKLLTVVQQERQAAGKARRALQAATNRENRLASKRALATGAFCLEL